MRWASKLLTYLLWISTLLSGPFLLLTNSVWFWVLGSWVPCCRLGVKLTDGLQQQLQMIGSKHVAAPPCWLGSTMVTMWPTSPEGWCQFLLLMFLLRCGLRGPQWLQVYMEEGRSSAVKSKLIVHPPLWRYKILRREFRRWKLDLFSQKVDVCPLLGWTNSNKCNTCRTHWHIITICTTWCI